MSHDRYVMLLLIGQLTIILVEDMLMISLLVLEMLTHNMKRMSTGLLRKQSVESKMVEEMRQAEEKINNAKIYAILQQRK